jgi:hypothetical protein
MSVCVAPTYVISSWTALEPVVTSRLCTVGPMMQWRVRRRVWSLNAEGFYCYEINA